MRLKDAYIIWTVYFNEYLSRKRGRRLSKRECVRNPKISELLEAAKRLGYDIILVNEEARYPAVWWLKSGYIAIKKQDNLRKYQILKNIAKEIRRMRGGK